MQEKFNFIYDPQNYLSDLDLIIQEINREVANPYRDWEYNLHKPYKTTCVSMVLQGRDNKSIE